MLPPGKRVDDGVQVSADYPEAAAAAPSAPLASAQEAAPVAAPAPAYSGVSAFANVTGGEYDEAVPPQVRLWPFIEVVDAVLRASSADSDWCLIERP